MAFVAGKDGSFTVNGTEIEVEQWEATDEATEQETTGTGSGGYYESISCIKKLSGSVNANWDSSLTPYDNPPNLQSGNNVTNMVLTASTGQTFTMSTAKILNVKTSLDAKGKVTWSMNFVSQGSYTITT